MQANKARSIEVIVVIDCKPDFNKQYPHGVYTYTQVCQTPPVLIHLNPEINAETDLIMLPYSSGTTGKLLHFRHSLFTPRPPKRRHAHSSKPRNVHEHLCLVNNVFL